MNRFSRKTSWAYAALAGISFLALIVLAGRSREPILLFENYRGLFSVPKPAFLICWSGMAALIYLIFLTLSVLGYRRLMESLPPLASNAQAPENSVREKNTMLAMLALVSLGVLDSLFIFLLLQSRGVTFHFFFTMAAHVMAGLWILFLALWSLNRWFGETLRIMDPASCFSSPEKEDEHWKWGLYGNRRDPRFFVPRRKGKGRALNMAHCGIVLILLLIVLGMGTLLVLSI